MRRQSGMGIIGIFLVIAVVGFFAIIGFKLVPAYLEYFAIKRAFVNTAQNDSQNVSPKSIRDALDRRFDVDLVKSINSSDVEITKNGTKYMITADYHVSVSLLSNVSLRVDFHPTSNP
jgi:hypothetical protein